MIVRTYVRRSKNDERKQQFSLDVQEAGRHDFVARLGVDASALAKYVDDGKSGDDFHSRAGLRKLLQDTKPGDIIVCRDQSRLGRDAIEVPLVVRDLVRDRGCRLFYYATGQEVAFANAIDQATTFIQGTGHQMELEAIRSRTREALRSRVRAGRIAGGRCYGYTLVRKQDATGRGYTLAIVNEDEAKVVRRIFKEFLGHWGLKKIARKLNLEGIPSPSAGRRGTGTWSPGAIRAMLMNPRYRGVYVHGRLKKVRTAEGMQVVKSDPADVLAVDVPEWRIVDDETWFAVQKLYEARATGPIGHRSPAKYALSGIARCAECGGAIGCAITKRGTKKIRAYACVKHHQRGPRACSAPVYQPMDELEHVVAEYLRNEILVPDRIAAEVRAQMPRPAQDVKKWEAEIEKLRKEQQRLAKACALTDDVAEIASALQQNQRRLRGLEAQVAQARRSPVEHEEIAARARAKTEASMKELREHFGTPEGLRHALLEIVPDALKLYANREHGRWSWTLEGVANLSRLQESSFNCGGDPEVSRSSSGPTSVTITRACVIQKRPRRRVPGWLAGIKAKQRFA